MTWPTPPLGSLVETIVPARDKPDDLTGSTPWVRIEDFDGKYLSGSRSGQGVSEATIRSMPLRVFPPGTVVCSCSCTMGTTAIVTRPLVTNQTFIGLVPRSSELSSDFLFYALQGHRDRLTSTATGAIQSYLSREDFRALRIPIPDITTQRAIADYLDRETSRLDALIAAKQRMVELLEERFWSWVTRQIDQRAPSFLPLRRFLSRITDGPFGSSLTSSDYSESGARVVRLGNIARGHFRDDDAAFITPEYFQLLLRHRVLRGDLLIAGLGDTNNHVGRACVAPDLGLAIVKADCYCASVNPTRGTAEFLALYLSSPLGARNVSIAARGTTRSRINLDIAREIEVPVLPVSVQKEVTEAAVGMRRHCEEVSRSLQLQIEFLHERRQALITAAVTGQLDIPDAA